MGFNNNNASDAIKDYEKYLQKYTLKLASLSNKKLISTSFKKQLDQDLFSAEVFSKAHIYVGLYVRTTYPENNKSYLKEVPDSTIEDWISLYKEHPIDNTELMKNTFWFNYAENYVFTLNAQVKDRKEFDYDSPSYHLDKIKYAKEVIANQNTLAYFISSYIFRNAQQNKFEKSLITIYNEFQEQFPNSSYLPFITPEINKIKEYHKKIEADYDRETVFINNYNHINSLEELINQFKGHNIYVDVWATWCGPCKDEFKYNQELKHFLKENDIEMIYISFDKAPGHQKWLEMIKYYNLKGSHIRNNDLLYQDLFKEYQEDGSIMLPWYLIINKKGDIVVRHAKRPSEQEELFNQLKTSLVLQ